MNAVVLPKGERSEIRSVDLDLPWSKKGGLGGAARRCWLIG